MKRPQPRRRRQRPSRPKPADQNWATKPGRHTRRRRSTAPEAVSQMIPAAACRPPWLAASAASQKYNPCRAPPFGRESKLPADPKRFATAGPYGPANPGLPIWSGNCGTRRNCAIRLIAAGTSRSKPMHSPSGKPSAVATPKPSARRISVARRCPRVWCRDTRRARS